MRGAAMADVAEGGGPGGASLTDLPGELFSLVTAGFEAEGLAAAACVCRELRRELVRCAHTS